MSAYKQQLKIYNSLSSKKEVFKSINKDLVGMYVCGPTVYNTVHLGNFRTFISFDLIRCLTSKSILFTLDLLSMVFKNSSYPTFFKYD